MAIIPKKSMKFLNEILNNNHFNEPGLRGGPKILF